MIRVLALFVLCVFFDSFSMVPSVVYNDLKIIGNGCFCVIPSEKVFLAEQARWRSVPSAMNVRYQCTSFCGRLVVGSIFESSNRLREVLSKINVEDIYWTKNLRADRFRLVCDDEAMRLKWSLFSPPSLELKDAVKVFRNIFGNDNNYELSESCDNYSLACAVFVLSTRIKPSHFWNAPGEEVLVYYLNSVCGAIRKFLSVVEGVEVEPELQTASYVSILSTCYDYYRNGR